jgi:inner membrane protein
LYAPVGAALTCVGEPALALVGIVVAVVLSTPPDADQRLPVEHRGPTHTVWFVLGVSLAVGAVGALVGLVVGAPGMLAVTVGAAAALSLTSHLLADSLTPMGIRPFWPLSGWHHTFEITPAKNPRANTTMFGTGLLFVLLCQALALL